LRAQNGFEITAIGAEGGIRPSGATGDGEIDTSNARNGSRTLARIFAGDTASRSVAIEKKSDAGGFDRAPNRCEIIRDRRSITVLEIAQGRNPDPGSASEFLLRPSHPTASGSALLRAHAR
jgi:hypothetical protein